MIQQGQNIIPPDNESIYQALATLQTSNPQQYLAIVSPSPLPPGIGGFLFDIPGDEEVRLRSQITNYYLENNTPVQDNIALEPPTITLRGIVAELAGSTVLAPPSSQVTNPLPLVPGMMPPMTPSQQEAFTEQQEASRQASESGYAAAAASGTSQNLYSTWGASGTEGSVTRQTNAFLYFRELWAGQQLMSVQTPWGIWENCAILEIRPVQDSKTKYMTDFTITFQEMRFAGEATVTVGSTAGRNQQQTAPKTQNGNAGQTPLPPPAANAPADDVPVISALGNYFPPPTGIPTVQD